jgi:hypothetical protein
MGDDDEQHPARDPFAAVAAAAVWIEKRRRFQSPSIIPNGE